MAINPAIIPMTAPAIAPADVFFFFFFLGADGVVKVVSGYHKPAEVLPTPPDCEDFLEVVLDFVDDEGDAHPTVALLGAHPSIKWAYACAPLVLGDHICCTLEPSTSYMIAVSLWDMDISE